MPPVASANAPRLAAVRPRAGGRGGGLRAGRGARAAARGGGGRVRGQWEAGAPPPACWWRGWASYKRVVVAGERTPDAAWYSPEPKPAAEEIRGWYAFWHGVEVKP